MNDKDKLKASRMDDWVLADTEWFDGKGGEEEEEEVEEVEEGRTDGE